MFLTNIRFQIASVCFLCVLGFDYFRRRKLPTLTTRVFGHMLLIAAFNLCCDIVTVYAICNIDTVSPHMLRLSHQLFIGSLDVLIYCLFIYVAVISRQQRRISRLRLALYSLPFAVSMLMVIFGGLEYYNDGVKAYSCGPMANTVYVCVTIYIFMIDAFIHHYRDNFSRRKRATILIATLIWVAVAVIQSRHPELLISGLGVSLMLMYIYLTFENPLEYYDRETSSFNRRAFRLMITELLEKNKPFYAADIVIENINRINARYGSRVGAQLIHRISGMLTERFDKLVFHYRGNALVVLEGSEKLLNERLSEAKEMLDKAWEIDGLRLRPVYHIDVIECPRYADKTDEVFGMLDYLYSAQETANGSPIRAACEETERSKRRAETVERIIEEALQSDGLEVVYQPIYSVTHGGFATAEALVRLKDTQTVGFIPPDEFIPLAEKRGLINKLGEQVVNLVCGFAARERLTQYGLRYIEVNLSGMQMDDPELAGRMREIIELHELSPAFINFEVTESVAVDACEVFRQNLQSLRLMGASFSMDDFGTGYSNLKTVAEARYDLIKFDKSLLWPCFGDKPENPRIVLENMARMAVDLKLPIVAECVETHEQAELLRSLGVEYMQGYLYSKPLRENDFVEFIRERAA